MDIFQFEDYREYVSARLKSLPSRGRGQYKLISEHLRIHSTTVSQIFAGDRNLSPDQACGLARYFELSRTETEYWVLLTQREDAQTPELREILSRRIAQMKAGPSSPHSSSVPHPEKELDHPLGAADQALYYSHWYYGAIRIAGFVPALQTVDALSRHLFLPITLIRQVVDFLIQSRLCEEDPKTGKLKSTLKRTDLSKDTPFLSRHHQNWRIKALEKLGRTKPEELSYTCPMSISVVDSVEVRKILVDAVFQINRLSAETQGEKLACLNIDWFDF